MMLASLGKAGKGLLGLFLCLAIFLQFGEIVYFTRNCYFGGNCAINFLSVTFSWRSLRSEK
jgi:hypothetical protein